MQVNSFQFTIFTITSSKTTQQFPLRRGFWSLLYCTITAGYCYQKIFSNLVENWINNKEKKVNDLCERINNDRKHVSVVNKFEGAYFYCKIESNSRGIFPFYDWYNVKVNYYEKTFSFNVNSKSKKTNNARIFNFMIACIMPCKGLGSHHDNRVTLKPLGDDFFEKLKTRLS